MADKIYYKKGYKYQLNEDYDYQTDIIPNQEISDMFIKLDTNGLLTILTGYAWDGPSGPVIDTNHNMRASLVHDALYQLLRNENWDEEESEKVRKKADKIFRKICIDDGVDRTIANAYYYGLRIGADFAADPKNKKELLEAP